MTKVQSYSLHSFEVSLPIPRLGSSLSRKQSTLAVLRDYRKNIKHGMHLPTTRWIGVPSIQWLVRIKSDFSICQAHNGHYPIIHRIINRIVSVVGVAYREMSNSLSIRTNHCILGTPIHRVVGKCMPCLIFFL